MKIGIDISQLAYSNTGVANYLQNLVIHLIEHDEINEYILFFSSLRRPVPSQIAKLALRQNVQLKVFKFPPAALNFLWNRMHILPIDTLIGKVDLFLTSDWTEPPITNGMKGTILYDLVVFKFPEETADKIIAVQKSKLKWVEKESKIVFCISEATKKDAQELLKINPSNLHVIYPGLTL